MKNPLGLTCSDSRHPYPRGDHPTCSLRGWCPYADSVDAHWEELDDERKAGYSDDFRCLNQLKFCTKNKRVVVANRYCDVPEHIAEIKARLEETGN